MRRAGAFCRAHQGLYSPELEHDACGIGFIADLKARKSHELIADGLKILANLEHRGAVGADPLCGDGAGILIQIPHDFFAAEADAARLRAARAWALRRRPACSCPQIPEWRANACEAIVEKVLRDEGLPCSGWRDVPVNNAGLPQSVTATEPVHRQVFIGRGPGLDDDTDLRAAALSRAQRDLERHHRGVALLAEDDSASIRCRCPAAPSSIRACSCRSSWANTIATCTIRCSKSALVLVHQRFSTNTFPSWKLAHPYRMIAHNGEINTLRGNVNWMAARQASVSSPLFGDSISKLWPISYEGQSDTACFDNALEFLVQGGYSLAHAMMMLIPEAWAGNPLMDEKRRAFYEYHAALMEPWDGPAAIAFTDGRQIGATLDRNGLRPARYFITSDDRVILASEMGVLPYPEDKIVHKWRLQPGKMLLIDLEKGGIISDEEIKAELAAAYPYQEWLDAGQIRLQDLPTRAPARPKSNVPLLDLQQAFGYTQESWKFLMAPMVESGQEAIGSMGTDTPVSALSNKSKLLHTYFKQNFAQVTNPPIDPIREELVMSLVSFIGPRPNILDLQGTLDAEAARGASADPHQRPDRPPALARRRAGGVVPHHHARHHLQRRSGRRGHGERAGRAQRAGRTRGSRRLQHHHPVRPRDQPGAHRHSVAAGDLGRASSPDPQGPAHVGRASWWKPAKRTRCTSSARSRAMAPKPSTPTSRSRPSRRGSPNSPSRSNSTKRSSATSRPSTRASSR